MPAFSRAFFKDMKTPLIFCKVPLIPVVGPIPLVKNSMSCPSIFARATSVVALPISTPATYFISPILSSTQIISGLPDIFLRRSFYNSAIVHL
jgi:hypothetical protein